MDTMPSYLRLLTVEMLDEKVKKLKQHLKKCTLCPRNCKCDRYTSKLGICKAPSALFVSSVFPHFGEEPPLVGHYGSGTIFLSHCNLRCVFCQNYDISHLGAGNQTTPEQLAEYMLYLQSQGCHNINFVTPTHYAPQIVEGIAEAARKGLELPIVWNCGGYESLEILRILDGVVDIYMPDIKFLNPKLAKKYLKAPDYPEIVKEAVKEMHRQVGDLVVDQIGLARRGLLIRHLVMPGCMEDTENILRFIAEEISLHSYVNIMDQYSPLYNAEKHKEINRHITLQEYEAAIEAAKKYGLHRGFGISVHQY